MAETEEKRCSGGYVKELKKVSYIAAPMVTVSVLQYLLQVVSVVMVGHLGQLVLSSVAIATSLTNVTGFSLLSLNPSISVTSLTISTLHFTVPYGFGAASSIRVSNELGAGNPRSARVAVGAAMAIEAVIVSASLFCSRNVLGLAYSNDRQIQHYIAVMTPFLCLSIITDSLQAVLSGVARGCGWQHIGAYINLGAFYLVGLPVGALLGFVAHLRGKGLWIGIVAGSIVQSTLLSLISVFTDWEKQATKAKERVLVRK
ncbi:hypothetical protein HS088_TW03G00299 [Tripterygium wilfordii]|uniref:MATE efflux family protein n=1 Tax=Tripterygium wilfordii TaxID=458696 RepID=A0A7J7DUK3_TRIWF|nr:hypothetical protein HS088_TW03G00299 [Tripterygium wilfordii]